MGVILFFLEVRGVNDLLLVEPFRDLLDLLEFFEFLEFLEDFEVMPSLFGLRVEEFLLSFWIASVMELRLDALLGFLFVFLFLFFELLARKFLSRFLLFSF